jgi:hypothetical protein
VALLVVVTGTADVERRSLVRVDESTHIIFYSTLAPMSSCSPHVVTVRPDFELAGISVALESDGVGE